MENGRSAEERTAGNCVPKSEPSRVVTANDPVIFRQLPVIQRIIADETWLEGERRGCTVAPSDAVVRNRVCEIIPRIGQELREAASRACASEVAARHNLPTGDRAA